MKESQNNMIKNVLDKRKCFHSPLYVSKKNNFAELQFFKNQIDLNKFHPNNYPYSTIKTSIALYRFIFISIGVLYFTLGLILFSKSLNWTSAFLFGSNFTVKSLLCGACSLSTIFCITLGAFLSSEKEAVKKTFYQAKENLKKIYERKTIQHNIKFFSPFSNEYRKSAALKHIYSETLEKLHAHKEDTLNVLRRISNSNSLDDEKREKLFNQAILELKERMEDALDHFNGTQISFFNH